MSETTENTSWGKPLVILVTLGFIGLVAILGYKATNTAQDSYNHINGITEAPKVEATATPAEAPKATTEKVEAATTTEAH